MAENWRELYERIPAERRERIEKQVANDLAEMRLAEIRRARDLTQQEIAGSLDVNQAWVSKVERQADMYVSTLRSYIEALGGELDIVARFPEGAIRLSQFSALTQLGSESSTEVAAATVITGSSAPNVVLWTDQRQRGYIASGVSAPVWDAADQSQTPQSRTPSHNTPARRTPSVA